MSIDMFLDPEDDPRIDGPVIGEEREMLVGFLRWQRQGRRLQRSRG